MAHFHREQIDYEAISLKHCCDEGPDRCVVFRNEDGEVRQLLPQILQRQEHSNVEAQYVPDLRGD